MSTHENLDSFNLEYFRESRTWEVTGISYGREKLQSARKSSTTHYTILMFLILRALKVHQKPKQKSKAKRKAQIDMVGL